MIRFQKSAFTLVRYEHKLIIINKNINLTFQKRRKIRRLFGSISKHYTKIQTLQSKNSAQSHTQYSFPYLRSIILLLYICINASVRRSEAYLELFEMDQS
jgi:hypothetical protein